MGSWTLPPASKLCLVSLRAEWTCSVDECLPIPLDWTLQRAFQRPLGSKGTSDRPGFLSYLFLGVITRSQKEQRPKVCPKDGPGAPADQGRPPEDYGRDSSTDLKDPQPGFQEQQKDQQLERTEHHEDSDL